MEVKIEPPVAKIIRKYGGGGSEYLLDRANGEIVKRTIEI